MSGLLAAYGAGEVATMITALFGGVALVIREVRSTAKDVKEVQRSVGSVNGESLQSLLKRMERGERYSHWRAHQMMNWASRVELKLGLDEFDWERGKPEDVESLGDDDPPRGPGRQR